MSGNTSVSFIASIMAVQDERELLTAIRVAGRAIGYDKILFGMKIQVPFVGDIQHVASAYPTEYQKLYEERDFVNQDPTVAHCLSNSKPLVWSEHLYDEYSHELLEESRAYGLGHGLSVPLHERAGVMSMLSLGRDKPFDSHSEREQVIAEATVLASCVHVASAKLIVPGLLAERRPRLSPRERECFQLVAAGKSNWDMGCILGISEAAVAFHVKNILRKLQVSSRTQAVALGVALGILG